MSKRVSDHPLVSPLKKTKAHQIIDGILSIVVSGDRHSELIADDAVIYRICLKHKINYGESVPQVDETIRNDMFERCIEFGRVAFVAYGSDTGKVCAIVDVIDQNRVVVDGPCSGVKRQVMNIKQLQLTKFVIPTPHGSRTKTVRKYWEKEDMSNKWKETKWAKKLESRKARQSMNDFDRYKLMRAKQERNRIVRTALAGLRKQEKKSKK